MKKKISTCILMIAVLLEPGFFMNAAWSQEEPCLLCGSTPKGKGGCVPVPCPNSQTTHSK